MKIIALFTLLLLTTTSFSQIEEKLPFVSNSEVPNRVYIHTNTDEPVEVKVLNSRGKVISTFTVRRKDTLHLNNLRPGTYYVVSVIKGERRTGSFVKE